MNSRIADISFDLLGYSDVVGQVQQWRESGRREYICVTNPHSVMLCRRNERMREATENAAMVLPDGIGIILAAKLLNLPNQGRVTGPELMLRLCDLGRQFKFRHFFLGGAPGVADRLADRLAAAYPRLEVVGTMSPPFRELNVDEDAALVARINDARPDLLWVGLGAPKQEIWMADHHGRLQAAAVIGVGAAFDFHSGNVPWAPRWMRQCGLEWLFRLARNPARMARRNLDTLPLPSDFAVTGYSVLY